METAALISMLRERNVKLSVHDDRIKLSAPPGALDPELKAALVSRKEDILAFLRKAEDKRSGSKALVIVKAGGSLPPLFVVTGHGADAYYLVSLARHLDAEQPVISVEPKGFDGSEPFDTLEDLAHYEIDEIRRFRRHGPYLIAGHCSGGLLALEVAQRLVAAGEDVALVALIGTPFPYTFNFGPRLILRAIQHSRGVLSGSLEDRKRYIKGRLERRRRLAAVAAGMVPEVLSATQRVEAATMAAVRRYKPQYYRGQIDLFVTSDEWRQANPWRNMAEAVHVHDLTKFGRDELLLGSYAAALAVPLRERLRSLGGR
jgi:thioesterase domain-containing protein